MLTRRGSGDDRSRVARAAASREGRPIGSGARSPRKSSGSDSSHVHGPAIWRGEFSNPSEPRCAQSASSLRVSGRSRQSARGKLPRQRQRYPPLSEMSRGIGLTNADVAALGTAREARPAKPMRFE